MRRFFDPETSDFIRLSNGLEYIKKFEVTGLRWERFLDDQDQFQWRLKVFFSEAPHSVFYGDDTRAIMEAFELPPEPPPDAVFRSTRPA